MVTIGITIAGCGREERHPTQADLDGKRIAELQARVSDLENRFETFRTNLQSALEAVEIFSQKERTNLEAFQLVFSQIEEQNAEARTLMETFYSSLTNRPVKKQSKFLESWETPVQHPLIATQPSPTGVPQAIYDQIYAEARKEWPTDYQMQDYEINKQIAAYLKLHSQPGWKP